MIGSLGGALDSWSGALETQLAGQAAAASIELWIGGIGGPALRVLTFSGTEELSALFRFEVTFASALEQEGIGADVVSAVQGLTQLEVDLLLVGRPALLSIRTSGRVPRTVQGIVTHLERLGPVGHVAGRSFHGYRAVIEPKMSLAKLRTNTRIFQDATARTIVDQVLREHGVATSWPEGAAVPGREYCVQYQETDYAFVTRLVAEIGFYFYFEPSDAVLATAFGEAAASIAGSAAATVAGLASGFAAAVGTPERVVFCARPQSYPPIHHESILANLIQRVTDASGVASALGDTAGDLFRSVTAPALKFRPDAGMSEAHSHVRAFSIFRRLTTESVAMRDFDFARPLHELRARVEAPVPPSTDGSQAVAIGDREKLESYVPYGDYLEPEVSNHEARYHLDELRARAREAMGTSSCQALAPGHRFKLEDHPDGAFNHDYVITKIEHEGHVPEWAEALSRHRSHGEGEVRVYENKFECAPASVAIRSEKPPHRVLNVVETAIVVGPEEHEIHTDRFGRVKVRFHWDRREDPHEHNSCWLRVMQAWAGAGWGHQFLPRVGMEVAVAFLAGDPDKPVVLGSLYNGVNPPAFGLPGSATKSGIRTQSTPRADGHNELSFEDAAGDEEIYLHAQRDHREHVRRNQNTEVRGDRREEVHGERRVAVHGDAESSVGGQFTLNVQGHARSELQGGSSTNVLGNRESNVSGRERVRVVRTADVHVHEDVTMRTEGCATIIVGEREAQRSFTVFTEGLVTVDGSCGVVVRSSSEVVVRSGRSSIRVCDDGIFLRGPVVRIDSEEAQAVFSDSIALSTANMAQITGEQVGLGSHRGGTLLIGQDVNVVGERVLLNSPTESTEPPLPAEAYDATNIEISTPRGEPMAGARFVVTRDDGSRTGGVTDHEGRASINLEGGGQIVFPDVSISDEQGEASGERRAVVVRRGEHLEQLAEAHGFDPEEVWGHGDNAELRDQRQSSQVLNPGDTIIIPGRRRAPQELRPRQTNSFTARERTVRTQVRFFDGDGPWANRACIVEGLGEPREEQTDGDGWLTIVAPATTESVTVAFPAEQARYHIAIGDLDPITEPRGVQMRLSLLGHYNGAVSSTWTEASRAALRAYQTARGLDVNGEPDAATRDALVSDFGS